MRRLSQTSVALCCILLSHSAVVFADDAPFELRSDTLSNGLRIVYVPWESPGVIAYYTLVNVGSRDEIDKGKTGFAHLFEHMMFRGTKRFPGKKYDAELSKYGADNNAFTTRDYTLYTITAPAGVLPHIVELEADRFINLHYTEADFKTETGAILGEYNKSYADPVRRMWEELSDMAYTRHTYKHTTLGYLTDIKKMPRLFDYSKKFFARYYTPDNSVIIVVGDANYNQLLALVRKHYGLWKGKAFRTPVPKDPEPGKGATRHVRWKGPSSKRMLIGYRIPGFSAGENPEKSMKAQAALQVIHSLCFDVSSLLYQRLVVKERQLLELESWDAYFARDAGLFIAEATMAPNADYQVVTKALQQEIDRVAHGQIDRERVDEVRSHLRYRNLMDLQTDGDIAGTVAKYIAAGQDLQAMSKYLRALRTLRFSELVVAAQKYLSPSRRFVVTFAGES